MTPKPVPIAESLAQGFAAGVILGMGEGSERRITGTTGVASLEQMVREAGLHDSAPGDLGAVVRISGRAYR